MSPLPPNSPTTNTAAVAGRGCWWALFDRRCKLFRTRHGSGRQGSRVIKERLLNITKIVKGVRVIKERLLNMIKIVKGVESSRSELLNMIKIVKGVESSRSGCSTPSRSACVFRPDVSHETKKHPPARRIKAAEIPKTQLLLCKLHHLPPHQREPCCRRAGQRGEPVS